MSEAPTESFKGLVDLLPALVRDIMRICEQVAKQQEGGASWQQRRRYDGLIQIPQTVSQTWRLNGLAPLQESAKRSTLSRRGKPFDPGHQSVQRAVANSLLSLQGSSSIRAR